jgi:predicted phosphodiesterase
LKIAVISDIHSAADHFRDALHAVRSEGFDRLVILGDLFTYGPDPAETLDIAKEAVLIDCAILITGNHDLLYMPGSDSEEYRARLPDWIRESADWTSARLNDCGAVGELPWQNEFEQDAVLLSHANPFGFGDWTYLNDEPSMAAAAGRLRERSFDWGVFGHVHRFRRLVFPHQRGGVATVGSIGQPRDQAERFSQWAMVTIDPEFSIEQRRVERDWSGTIEKIGKSTMSEGTKERLCRFYQ